MVLVLVLVLVPCVLVLVLAPCVLVLVLAPCVLVLVLGPCVLVLVLVLVPGVLETSLVDTDSTAANVWCRFELKVLHRF